MDLLLAPAAFSTQAETADRVVLDATYFALEPARDAAAAFAEGHLPGARFLDLEHLVDPDDPVPGQAPPAARFAERMTALGIGPATRVLLYDQAPHHTAARAWWLFRLFGLTNVQLLDGGFAKWRAEGRPIETGPVETGPIETGPVAIGPGGGVAATRDPARVRDLAQMRALVADGSAQILDARSAARFTGAEPDPRPSVAAGHIPGSRSLPYGRLFNANGTWKRGATLAAEFRAAGIDLDRPVVTTCGSGVTASVLLFGLALLGHEDWALYDGSWSEWGADPTTPKAVGL